MQSCTATQLAGLKVALKYGSHGKLRGRRNLVSVYGLPRDKRDGRDGEGEGEGG